jgi:hypothetical protein
MIFGKLSQISGAVYDIMQLFCKYDRKTVDLKLFCGLHRDFLKNCRLTFSSLNLFKSLYNDSPTKNSD